MKYLNVYIVETKNSDTNRFLSEAMKTVQINFLIFPACEYSITGPHLHVQVVRQTYLIGHYLVYFLLEENVFTSEVDFFFNLLFFLLLNHVSREIYCKYSVDSCQ